MVFLFSSNREKAQRFIPISFSFPLFPASKKKIKSHRLPSRTTVFPFRPSFIFIFINNNNNLFENKTFYLSLSPNFSQTRLFQICNNAKFPTWPSNVYGIHHAPLLQISLCVDRIRKFRPQPDRYLFTEKCNVYPRQFWANARIPEFIIKVNKERIGGIVSRDTRCEHRYRPRRGFDRVEISSNGKSTTRTGRIVNFPHVRLWLPVLLHRMQLGRKEYNRFGNRLFPSYRI